MAYIEESFQKQLLTGHPSQQQLKQIAKQLAKICYLIFPHTLAFVVCNVSCTCLGMIPPEYNGSHLIAPQFWELTAFNITAWKGITNISDLQKNLMVWKRKFWMCCKRKILLDFKCIAKSIPASIATLEKYCPQKELSLTFVLPLVYMEDFPIWPALKKGLIGEEGLAPVLTMSSLCSS